MFETLHSLMPIALLLFADVFTVPSAQLAPDAYRQLILGLLREAEFQQGYLLYTRFARWFRESFFEDLDRSSAFGATR